MKVIMASILFFLALGCSEENSKEQLKRMNASKDIPTTPKSKFTTTNPDEDLAPQTCYYGCKARK